MKQKGKKVLAQKRKCNIDPPSMWVMLLSGGAGALLFAFLPVLSLQIRQVINPPVAEPSLLPHPKIPTQIQVERLDIDLPIKVASVSANNWQIFDHAASWLQTSGNIYRGNMVLYGHNSSTLFGKIIQLGTQDEIIITNSYGQKQRYKVTEAFQGTRYDLWPVTANEDRLTLYTCSGWFDTYRFFVLAEKIDTE